MNRIIKPIKQINMNELNNVVELFEGKLYGEKFTFAIEKNINFKGKKYYTFGKVYQVNNGKCFLFDSLKPFLDIRECLNELILFSGFNPSQKELKELYNKVDSFA